MAPVSKLFLLVIFTLAVIIHSSTPLPSRVKRQGFCWNCDNSSTTRSTTPRGESSSGATPSIRDMYGCTSRCQTTSQYSPVCGSNGLSYDNISKLTCANSCGANVRMVRQGTCSPL